MALNIYLHTYHIYIPTLAVHILVCLPSSFISWLCASSTAASFMHMSTPESSLCKRDTFTVFNSEAVFDDVVYNVHNIGYTHFYMLTCMQGVLVTITTHFMYGMIIQTLSIEYHTNLSYSYMF